MENGRTVEEIRNVLKAHWPTLRDRYKVRRIGVFGSRVRGDNTSLSDVDILVDLQEPVGWEIVDLHHYLESLLGIKVDLVTKGAVVRKPLLWQSIQESLVYVET